MVMNHLNTSVVHMHDHKFSKRTLIAIFPRQEKKTQTWISHDFAPKFAPKFTPKQAFLESTFGGL